MASPLRVFILINELLPGGAQRIVLDIVSGIDRTRFEPTIVCLKSYKHLEGRGQRLDAEVEALGVHVVSLEGDKKFSVREARALFRLLRTERPDVLHTFLPYAGVLGRVIGRIAGVRRIISTQCNLPAAYDRKVYLLDRLTLPLAHLWTAATEGIEEAYGGHVAYVDTKHPKKHIGHVTVVAGVNLPTFDARVQHADRLRLRAELGLTQPDVLVLMVARLISWKGHQDLIQAISLLPTQVHLALVGWGPLEATLKEQAERLGIADRVHFLGVRADVPELLAASDVYAQTHAYASDGTVWKGPNTSQMEACAAYVPSMSTAVPRIETLLEEGVTGRLATPNDPAAIAAAITALLEDQEATREMVMNARARVEERYSIASMVKNYETVYLGM